MAFLVHTRNLTITYLTSTHRLIIYPKSLNSYEQLPNTISGRLLKNFSNQKEFKIAKVEYEDAPKKSGYDVDLTYSISKSEKPKMRIRRKICFNPAFSKSVSTHVANTFLQLLI